MGGLVGGVAKFAFSDIFRETREGAGEDVLPGDVGNGSGLVLGVLKVGWWDVEMRGQGNGYGLTGVGRPRGQMGRWSWMW